MTVPSARHIAECHHLLSNCIELEGGGTDGVANKGAIGDICVAVGIITPTCQVNGSMRVVHRGGMIGEGFGDCCV